MITPRAKQVPVAMGFPDARLTSWSPKDGDSDQRDYSYLTSEGTEWIR